MADTMRVVKKEPTMELLVIFAQQNDPWGGAMRGALRGALIGAAVGAVVAIVLYFIKKKK